MQAQGPRRGRDAGCAEVLGPHDAAMATRARSRMPCLHQKVRRFDPSLVKLGKDYGRARIQAAADTLEAIASRPWTSQWARPINSSTLRKAGKTL